LPYNKREDQGIDANGAALRMNGERIFSRSPGEPSDDSLAARVARGDSVALEALYDRYGSTVLGLALRILGDRAAAEDVLQETFWRVWRSANTFQSQRGSFRGWLFRIAHNLAIDAYRRGRAGAQAQPEDPELLFEQAADPQPGPDQETEQMSEHRRVRAAIRSLPDDQRKVIELAFYRGMTRQEIAQATGEPLGTIHTRARLALEKLRRELRQEPEGH
jgi:RNA polymerase sigma-70 factor (ECF subfamily)